MGPVLGYEHTLLDPAIRHLFRQKGLEFSPGFDEKQRYPCLSVKLAALEAGDLCTSQNDLYATMGSFGTSLSCYT